MSEEFLLLFKAFSGLSLRGILFKVRPTNTLRVIYLKCSHLGQCTLTLPAKEQSLEADCQVYEIYQNIWLCLTSSQTPWAAARQVLGNLPLDGTFRPVPPLFSARKRWTKKGRQKIRGIQKKFHFLMLNWKRWWSEPNSKSSQLSTPELYSFGFNIKPI